MRFSIRAQDCLNIHKHNAIDDRDVERKRERGEWMKAVRERQKKDVCDDTQRDEWRQ